jgi:ribosomal subunit interface protein
MKVTYSGTNGALSPKQQQKIESKFQKLSKLLDRRGEKTAHVVVTSTRHLQKAEVKLNFYDHALIGAGSDPDVFTALGSAIEKLEQQTLKLRAKWRDTSRTAKASSKLAVPAPEPAEEAPVPRILKMTSHQRRKPMTVEEALLEMGDRTHYAFRASHNERTTVLVRRADGHIDLIEG